MADEKFYSGDKYLIPAQCPNCGGLFGSTERGRIQCKFCNSEFFIPEIFAGADEKIKNFYEIAYNAQGAGNFKEGYDYFTKVIELSPDEYLAWFGKGVAAGYLSSGNNVRAPEVISCFEKAIQRAPKDTKTEIEKVLGSTASSIGTDLYYWLATNNLNYEDNLKRCLDLFYYLESKGPDPGKEHYCWKSIVIIAQTAVLEYSASGTRYYHYPFKNIAQKYSEKIREKYDVKFRNKFEIEARTKLIKTLSILGVIIVFILLCAYVCNQ
jgi:tetratricopeptide (TPR) repeat protein